MHLKKQIPYSTISTWRATDYTVLVGHELRALHEEAVEQYEVFLVHKHLKKTVRVLTKVWLAVSTVILPVLQRQKKYAHLFVEEIQRLFTVIPKDLALRLAGISFSSFYARLAAIKTRCGLSPLDLCLKRHPLQLATGEVIKIKRLFADERYACWPAVSLYYEGLRKHRLYISLSTFYKYVNLLGLKRRFPKAFKKTEGLRACRPNQYLHVDTTLWELECGIKAAIAFVSDNYAKAVLGWSLSLKHDAENVKQALDMSIKTIHLYHPGLLCATLVADGGGENHALTIEELLRQTKRPEITKVIAQKDIVFSNSPVEAVNKIMKRYLRHYKPQNLETLKAVLAAAVKDYNEQRPHGSLEGLTPMEAYAQPAKAIDFAEEKQRARALRIEQNRIANCSGCREE